MIDDTVPHAMTLVKDGGLWRSTCVCGWTSKLCRNKAAAERSKFYHLGPQVTVTSKRSRMPARLKRPPGSLRLARYDSSAEGVLDAKDRITPAKRAKAKKDRAEAKVKKDVRAVVAERDGFCRLFSYADLPNRLFGACEGESEWSHVGDFRRSKTRGMDPTVRHQSAHSVIFCTRHHVAYDQRKFVICYRTERGADGPLRFVVRDADAYEEPLDD